MLLKVVRESVTSSVFGMLCILDGVRAIENEDKGELKLYYERSGKSTLINDNSKVMLHDLL